MKAHVLGKTTDAQSIKNIARDYSVSEATTKYVINEEGNNYKLYYHSLPSHLSFDEFKYANGNMALEYNNAKTGDILGLLPARGWKNGKKSFLISV